MGVLSLPNCVVEGEITVDLITQSIMKEKGASNGS